MCKPLILISGFGLETPFGGIERFVFSLSEYLVKRDITPTVFGLWDYGNEFEKKWIQHLNRHGIQAIAGAPWIETSPYLSFRRSLAAFIRFASKNPIDLIHSHSQFGDVAACIAKWKLGYPIIRSIHTEFEWKKRPFRRVFLSNIIYPLLFNLEIGISPSITQKLNHRPIAKIISKQSPFIPNTIDLKRFQGVQADRELGRTAFQIPPSSFVVGSVGRLTEQKGYKYLIQAADLICHQTSDVFFLVFGSGDQEDMLKREVLARGLETRFLLPGPIANVENVFPLFDLFVSSSNWEGLPTVLMESMASGIPIVATDIAGNQDLICNNENGWLVPAANPETLAKAVLDAIHNPSEREKYSYANIEKVKQYSIDSVGEIHRRLYQEFSGQRRG